MEQDKNDMLDKFKTHVRDLLFTYNFKHEKLLKVIRETIQEETTLHQLPKEQVLYNKAYGGFSLSKPFKTFVASQLNCTKLDTHSKEFRVTASKYIEPFGVKCLQQHQELKDLLLMAEYYNLNNVAYIANDIYHRTKDIKHLECRRAYIEEHLNDSTLQGKQVIEDQNKSTSQLMYKLIHYPVALSGYTKDAYQLLLDCIDSDIMKAKEIIKDKMQKIASIFPLDTFKELEANLHSVFSEKTSLHSLIDNPDFLSSIATLDLNHAQTWMYQHHFNEKMMRCLVVLKRNANNPQPHDTDQSTFYDFLISHKNITVSHDVWQKLVRKVGLMCASGRCCDLDVCEVPMHMGWKIEEYDGQETICCL